MAVMKEFKNDLFRLFAARIPGLYIKSNSPERAIPEIVDAYTRFAKGLAKQTKTEVVSPAAIIWDPRRGLPEKENGDFIAQTKTLSVAFDQVKQKMLSDKANNLNLVFIFPHTKASLMRDPDALFALEELLRLINGDHGGHPYPGPVRLVFTGLMGLEDLPTVVSNLITVKELPLPDEGDITELLLKVFSHYETPEDVPTELVNAILGLDYREAMIAARNALTAGKNTMMAVERATTAKIEYLQSQIPFIKIIPPPTEPPPFAGMNKFMGIINRISDLVKRKDRKAPIGTGLFLIGPPGTGKSSSSAMLSYLTGFPRLEFMYNDLMQSLVGNSEERVRTLFQVIRSMNRVIVVMDEMDKQSPDMRGTASDGGLSARLQAYILKEIQEILDAGLDTLFLAFANREGNILPEFLDRFVVFSAGYPPRQTIERVFEVHMERMEGFKAEVFDFNKITDVLYAQFETKKIPVSPRKVTFILREARLIADHERHHSCPTQEEIIRTIIDMSAGKEIAEGVIARSVWDEEIKNTAGQFALLEAESVLEVQ